MKVCPQCNIEMKVNTHQPGLLLDMIEKIPDNIYESTRKRPYYTEVYICPKCGLVQQYASKEYLKYLN